MKKRLVRIGPLQLGKMLGALYGALGFIIGLIGAAVYNLLASWIGGIEVEVA